MKNVNLLSKINLLGNGCRILDSTGNEQNEFVVQEK